MLDERLLKVLACPKDKGELLYLPAEDLLYNPRLHLKYEVVDDIPVLLVDKAVECDDNEHQRLMSQLG